MHKGTGQDAIMRRIEEDMRGGEVMAPLMGPMGPMGTMTASGQMGLGADKRPKLERAHSAAEKENLPLQRSGSALRRQYSQQEAGVQQYGRGELDGLMRTHPHLLHPRQQVVHQTGPQTQGPPPGQNPGRRRAPGSPSSSDDELRSTPDCVSDENDKGESFVVIALKSLCSFSFCICIRLFHLEVLLMRSIELGRLLFNVRP